MYQKVPGKEMNLEKQKQNERKSQGKAVYQEQTVSFLSSTKQLEYSFNSVLIFVWPGTHFELRVPFQPCGAERGVSNMKR